MDEFTRAYLNDCVRLAMSVTIKCDNTIEAMNKRIKLLHGESYVDENHPEKYRYNLHACGDYHPKDTMMSITSLDTLQEIHFTKQNLQIHKKTKRAYTVDSEYTQDLIDAYPENYSLIMGILNPADMNDVLSAKDGQIVSYDKTAVEEQELTLIKELNQHCVGHHRRWNTRAHSYGHDFYPASYAGVFYSTLLPRILNLRLKRCKTYEAHSFHIKMYLASHYELDRYVRFMDMYQILFLYRNILYLERNCGKTQQFELLLKKLLTRRNIPISEINVRHLNDFDKDYAPELVVRTKSLNDIYNASDIDYLDLESLQNIEARTAQGNILYWQDHFGSISSSFKNSPSSIVQTKDLYSLIYDYSDAVPHPLEMVLLRQWVSWSFTNRYIGNVEFRDPRTAKKYFLKARDAFLYMYMVGLNYIGVFPMTIANIINCHELRNPLPDIYELAPMTTMQNEDLIDFCQYSYSQFPSVSTIVSNEAFYEKARTVYEEGVRQWLQTSNEHDMDRRAILHSMFETFYKDYEYKIPPFNIQDWVRSKSLPDVNYSKKESIEIMTEIFKNSTGYFPDDEKQIGNIQRALIAVFKQISSYSIQFISESNQSRVLPLAWSAIRAKSISLGLSSDGHWTSTKIEIQGLSSSLLSENKSMDIPIDLIENKPELSREDVLSTQNNIDTNISYSEYINIFIPAFTVEISD